MTRGPLEKTLGAIVGSLLGGLIALALPFWIELAGPVVWLPVILGALAGYAFGDRAIHGLARILGGL